MPTRLLLLCGALLLSGCEGVLHAALGVREVEPGEVGPLGALEIIDLQGGTDFASAHLPGATRVPLHGLQGHLSRTPERAWRPLLLVCTRPNHAEFVAPSAAVHRRDVRVLAGGMEAWLRAGLPVEKGPAPLPGDDSPPLHLLSRAEQLLAWAARSILRPLRLALTLLLLRLVWRAPGTPLRLVRRGLVVALAAEALGLVDLLGDLEHLWRPLALVRIGALVRGLGAIGLLALGGRGLWRLLDERVLHLDDPAEGCALERLCGRCARRAPVRCAVRDLLAPVALAVAAVAVMPLSAPLRPAMFRAEVLGELVDWGEPIVNHLVELRVYPLLAAGLLLASLPLVLRAEPGRLRRAESLFSAGAAFAGYPAVRHLVASAFRDAPGWAELWQAVLALLLVALLGGVLLRVRGARAGSAAP